MASGKSDYWVARMLNGLNGATATIASPLFIALFTVTPAANSFGTEVANTNAYASISITGNTTNWPTITVPTTTMANGAAFTYTTATGDWSSAANIVAAALKDSGTNGSGNQYYWGALTGTAGPVLSGNTASFAIGAVTIAET
jgi:hypothetical protein